MSESLESNGGRNRSRGAPLLLLFVLACLLPSSLSQYNTTCEAFLKAADSNRDDLLTQQEYANAVSAMTNGAVNADFASYGSALQVAYANAVVAGVGNVALGSGNNGQFCYNIYQALVQQLGITTTLQQCFIGMSIADQSPRDNLLSIDEYSPYADYMSGRVYGSSIAFNALPIPVQRVYNEFQRGGFINVTGSKPQDQSLVNQTQKDFLQTLCSQTSVAIKAGEAGAASAVNESSPAPTPSPTTSKSDGPLNSFSTCVQAMAGFDRDRNGVLDTTEYKNFVNKLSNFQYTSNTYDTLPQPLQDNYNALNEGSGIVVTGSKPWDTPTAAQTAHLQDVCTATDTALKKALFGSGGNTPTISPTASPTQNKAFVIQSCSVNLILSDGSGGTLRDSQLLPSEYLFFLNRVTSGKWSNYSYGALPAPLRANFDAFATDGYVDIQGARFTTATQEQRQFVERFCVATGEAITEAFTATAAPTASPSAPQPVLEPGQLTIFNAWIQSSDKSVTSATLLSGPDREGLEKGYKNYITDLVGAYITRNKRFLRDSRRLGLTDLTPDSIFIYQIDDISCPTGISNLNCQIAYANFKVNYANETSADLQRVATTLTNLTQTNIQSDGSGLQSYVEAANPGSRVKIQEPSNTTRPQTMPPTPAPTYPPSEQVPASSGGGSSAGIIIGVIVALILLGGGILYYRRRGGNFSFLSKLQMPAMPKLHLKSSKSDDAPKKDGEFDEEKGEFDFTGEPSVPSTKAGKGGLFGRSKSSPEEEDSGAGFSIQEDSPAKDYEDSPERAPHGGNVFSAFGRKKKNNNSGFATDYDENENIGAFHEEDAAADFANYGFGDEPSVNHQTSISDVFGGTASGADWNNQGVGPWGGNSWGGTEQKGFGAQAPEAVETSDSVSGSEESGSYDDDESDSDESDTYLGDDMDDVTRMTKDTNAISADSANLPDNVRQLDAMVESGDWDGVMAAATTFEGRGFEDGKVVSRDQTQRAHDEPSHSEADSESYDDDNDQQSNLEDSHVSLTSEERRRRAQYRGQIEALVRRVVPDELDNISAMMEQFAGREAELINTLNTMSERSATIRARKAIHKSKALPLSSGRFSSGGTDGPAAIAAASTLGYDSGRKEQAFEQAFDDDVGEEDEQSGSYDDEGLEDGNYESGSQSQSGSYDNDEEDEDSYRSGSQSGEGSYDEERETLNDDEQGSYESGSRSESGSYDEDNQEYDEDEQGSYESGSRSQSGSYEDEQGSYESESRSGSGSYDEDDDVEYEDDEEGVSQESGSRSQSGSFDEGSYESGSQSGSGSYYSDEDEDEPDGEPKQRALKKEDGVDYGYG